MVSGAVWTPGFQSALPEKQQKSGGPGFAAADPEILAECYMNAFGKGGSIRVPYWAHWVQWKLLTWFIPDMFQEWIIQKASAKIIGRMKKVS